MATSRRLKKVEEHLDPNRKEDLQVVEGCFSSCHSTKSAKLQTVMEKETKKKNFNNEIKPLECSL